MKAKLQLIKRHQKACDELKKIANVYIEKSTLKDVTTIVGKNLDISPQTVVNYIYGKAKDGYLTEAITSEFKAL